MYFPSAREFSDCLGDLPSPPLTATHSYLRVRMTILRPTRHQKAFFVKLALNHLKCHELHGNFFMFQ